MLSRAVTRATASVLVVTLSACSSMHTISSPAHYIESVRPKLVRITQTDGSRYFMIGPRLAGGDTIMGFMQPPKGGLGEFRELPLDSIAKFEAQQYVHTRTALAVLGAFGAWAVITFLVVHHVEHQSGQIN